MFSRDPAWNTPASSAARALHHGPHPERSVPLSPFPRIGPPTLPVATRSRRAQSASRIPPLQIPLRLRDGSRASIPLLHRNSSRICTYKTAELTPLESALAKKENELLRVNKVAAGTRGGEHPRGDEELSTFNCELPNRHNTFRIRTYTKGGGGPIPYTSTLTLTLDSGALEMRNPRHRFSRRGWG